ncbi:MAG: hypothetical protein JW902_02850 [Syntrophaceae bacterium]|nr:hypothetical protein [Syntrophaceae bacterium]
MRTGMKSISFVGVVVFAVFYLCSCAGPSVSVSPSSTAGHYNKIAVLPFQQVSPEDTVDQLIPRDIVGHRDLTEESGENVVESLFMAKLAENKKIEVVPVDVTKETYLNIADRFTTAKDAERIRQLGQELKAEAIVVGYVFRYEERQGTPYAVEKAASVAFELQLLDTRDGTRSWKATFNETQRSLMENLLSFRFFVKSKGRWITARELAEEGMDQVMLGFPGPR